MDTIYKAIGAVVLAAFIFAAVGLLYLIPTYFLWNAFMPWLFGLPKLTLLQTWGVLILSTLLFKSPGGSK